MHVVEADCTNAEVGQIDACRLPARAASRPACALLAFLAAALACAGDGPPPSAGPRMVEKQWTEQQAWQIASDPVLVLGEMSTDPDAEFGDVRGAVATSDGRIAVVDGYADAIRIFSPSGQLVRTIGRSGGGPGEFSDPGGLYLLEGDTLALWDLTTRRITLFDFEGNLAATERVRGPRSLIAGALSGHHLVTFVDIGGFTEGVLKGDPFYLSVVGFDGTKKDSIGPFEARRMFMVRRGLFRLFLDYILDPRTYVAAADKFFAVGNSSSDSVMLYDTSAQLRAVLRVPSAVRATTPADVQDYVDRLASGGASRIDQQWREAHLEMVETVEIPKTLPRFADVRVDGDGHVWVMEYPTPDQSRHMWYVFDSEGAWLGEVLGPDRSERVLHIGQSRLLTLARGDLDVPLIKVYTIHKH